ISLEVDLEPDEWIKNSGCSKHMMGNRKLCLSYKAYNKGNAIFGSNLHGNIIGKGQICDNKCRVTFSKHDSEITKDGKVIGRGIRKKGLYVMKLGNKPKDQICLATIDENSTLWHRRLGHANMRLIQSLASKELVRNLPKLKFDQHFCDACKIGKQAHASHKAKNIVSTTRCLELLHMDLFGPSTVRSYRGNRYTLVIVDDYSRYTWTRFLKDKTEAFDQFEIFSKKIQNQLGCTIVSIRTDHGREFDNEVQFREFCNANGITHNFSAPRTPQSNGVVERKNRTLQEMSRTMLNEQSLPQKFWKPTLDYFRVFGSKCFILNTKDYLTKFDPKSYEGIFLGYSQNSKAYIILNKHTRKIKESLNVTFDETPPPSKTSPLVDDDLDEEEAIKVTKKKNQENDIEDETLEIDNVGIKTSPSPNVVKSLIQIPRQGQVTRTKNKKTIVVDKNEILTREIQPHMKPWVDIIRENAICLGGHKDHVFACLCHMLYCIETSTRYNLAFFILKRMEKTRNKPKELLSYGMLLTRLFKHVVSVLPELAIDHYLSHDRVMHPLAPHYERKTRSDHGKKRPHESNSSSFSTTLNHPSLSRPLDDTIDVNDEESSHSNSSPPSQNVSSSSNVVPRVRQNPPHESHNLNTYLSETINLQI
ncbi:retrovirus-related pol polyprotein from transposon TNT 1-94, partial [Tanacetum coccineum]